LQKLPRKIAQVWVDTSRALDLPPISTYASTVTFNVQSRNFHNSLEDLHVIFNSSGLKDEEWFYVVSAGIDMESRSIIEIAEGLKCGKSVDEGLLELSLIIRRLTTVLKRMYEKCEPGTFYHRIRRYFAGWLNDPQLEGNGLLYELDSGDVYFNLAGGSAAQTATIQLIDILLDVTHEHQSKEAAFLEGKMKMSYCKEMRSYMPVSHRRYLIESEVFFTAAHIKEPIKNSPNYSECIKSLSDFRNEHIIMVTRYIVSQAGKSGQTAYGTGGSNPIPFLKQFRRDTNERLN
jgi:indoleamine 2,3-dioxygenase